MTDWLVIIVVVLFLLALLDGLRRKLRQRRGHVRVKLEKNIPDVDPDIDDQLVLRAELPNGGARTKTRVGDPPDLHDTAAGGQPQTAAHRQTPEYQAPRPVSAAASSAASARSRDIPVLMDAVELQETDIVHAGGFADSSRIPARDDESGLPHAESPEPESAAVDTESVARQEAVTMDDLDEDVSMVRVRARAGRDADEDWDDDSDWDEDDDGDEQDDEDDFDEDDEDWDDEDDYDDDRDDDRENGDFDEDDEDGDWDDEDDDEDDFDDDLDDEDDDQDDDEDDEDDYEDEDDYYDDDGRDYEDDDLSDDDYYGKGPGHSAGILKRRPGAGQRVEPGFGGEQLDTYELESDFGPAFTGDETPQQDQQPGGSERKSRLGSFLSRRDQGELFREEAAAEQAREPEAGDGPQEVVIINVMARPGQVFEGYDLLPVLQLQGLRLGEMSIFHKHSGSNGTGSVIFSMANMVKPGTFDLAAMENFSTPGVSFFLQLPNRYGNMAGFEQMLAAAEAVKQGLDGELKDENRSVFTRQTLEHYRQRINDFELKLLSRK